MGVKISEAIGNISTRHIEEAADYVVKRKKHISVWSRIGLIAACLAVAVLSICVFQSGWFGNKTDVATLDHETEIVFVKSKEAAPGLQLDGNVTVRQLTAEELASLFPNLPITAHAVFSDTEELLGLEGKIGTAKLVITTTDTPLLDTEIVGTGESSTVNGTSVVAGYFETGRNSVGVQNVIYYAAFQLGDQTVYVENGGTKAERETTKNDLAALIQALINHSPFDLSTVSGPSSADEPGNLK